MWLRKSSSGEGWNEDRLYPMKYERGMVEEKTQSWMNQAVVMSRPHVQE